MARGVASGDAYEAYSIAYVDLHSERAKVKQREYIRSMIGDAAAVKSAAFISAATMRDAGQDGWTCEELASYYDCGVGRDPHRDAFIFCPRSLLW